MAVSVDCRGARLGGDAANLRVHRPKVAKRFRKGSKMFPNWAQVG